MDEPDPERLRLYRYLGAQEAADYIAIMSLFTEAILAEWSASDVAARGLDLTVETIAARCAYLAEMGNLIISPREVRVTSIAEYQSQPARYTVSALGARLHREVEAFLSVTGGAREVPRELLALIADGLTSLDIHGDPETLAGSVSTIFGQFHEFAAAVTDFYTYVGGVITRSDLDGDEWAGFKNLLLDYLDTIIDSVRRYTPAICSALDRLRPELAGLLERITSNDSAFAALEQATSVGGVPSGEAVQRSRGRAIADWDQLSDWFAGSGSRHLRDAADRALSALLSTLKRINSSGNQEASIRRSFLKLASWFHAATPAEAHVLATCAFGLYGSRHLGFPLPDEIAEAVPATMSWWDSPPAPVPLSLRERGDRVPRGSAAVAPNHLHQRRKLLEARDRETARRAAACAELLAVGADLEAVKLSAAAMEVLLELLSSATSGGFSTLTDYPVALHSLPAIGTMVVRSESGSLTVHGRSLVIAAPGAMVQTAAAIASRGVPIAGSLPGADASIGAVPGAPR